MGEMEFIETGLKVNDLVSEYQQYQNVTIIGRYFDIAIVAIDHLLNVCDSFDDDYIGESIILCRVV